MIIRTLGNTMWSIADIVGAIGTGVNIFNLHFTSNGNEYTQMRFVDEADSGRLYYGDTLVNTYPQTNWTDPKYQQVSVAGGFDATNSMLITWFQQYAKNTTPSSTAADIVGALASVAGAIRDSGSDIPDPSGAEVGDVLTKGENGLEWAGAPSGLPAIGENDAGKVLTVNSTHTAAEWADAGDFFKVKVVAQLNSSL